MKRLMIAAVVLAALVGGGFFWMRDGKADKRGPEQAVKVERADIVQTLVTTGVVEPQNRVEIKPPISGRVEEILVREGDTVRKGDILVWMSSSERAALLDAARIKGAAEVERWAQLYKPAPLIAPVAGTVIARAVEPGQSVTTADAVLVLSDRLIIKAQVDETDIGMIQLRQKAAAALDAYPNRPIDAVVDHIAYEAQTVSNVTIYHVDVLPESVPSFMRSGMTANVTFHVDERIGVPTIPADAIHGDGGRWVWRRDPATGKPARVDITTGLSDGKRTEIISGLNEGDEVMVTRESFRAKPAEAKSNPFSPFGGGRPGRR